MDGYVQHTRVVIENVLSPIPMMDVLWNGNEIAISGYSQEKAVMVVKGCQQGVHGNGRQSTGLYY